MPKYFPQIFSPANVNLERRKREGLSPLALPPDPTDRDLGGRHGEKSSLLLAFVGGPRISSPAAVSGGTGFPASEDLANYTRTVGDERFFLLFQCSFGWRKN